VVERPVGHVDLLATLAEAFGRAVRGDERLYEGRSLWPLLRGDAAGWEPRFLFAQRRPPRAGDLAEPERMVALQTGEEKLILSGAGKAEFFELATDPLELHDRGDGGAAAGRLRAALEERLRSYRDLCPRDGSESPPPEAWREELRALGYAR